jgi:hypothetical protein
MRLVAGFSSRRRGFEPKTGHVGFVVDKGTLGQVSSESCQFPCQFSFHRGQYSWCNSGICTKRTQSQRTQRNQNIISGWGKNTPRSKNMNDRSILPSGGELR